MSHRCRQFQHYELREGKLRDQPTELEGPAPDTKHPPHLLVMDPLRPRRFR